MSSDEDLPDDWIPYSQRPTWADVVPLTQDDGDHPIVQIAYSDKFRDVFDYFRAVVATREKSLRALGLTTDALRLNPANYTVWQYRRDILRALDMDLLDELAYCEEVIVENAKNYQVWHHRRCIVEQLGDASRELGLTAEVLQLDAKNYHAWQHRQWAIKTFDLFDDELAYVDRLISQDVRNNSAWNQRFFVLNHTGMGAEVLQREITYALNRIRLVKNNESSWSFLRGLLQESDCALDQHADVVDFCEDLYEQQGCTSPHLLAFLVDLYEERCLRLSRGGDEADTAEIHAGGGEDPEAEVQRISAKLLQLCADMQNKHDTIRQKYWEYVAFNFRVQLERAAASKAGGIASSEAVGSNGGAEGVTLSV